MATNRNTANVPYAVKTAPHKAQCAYPRMQTTDVPLASSAVPAMITASGSNQALRSAAAGPANIRQWSSRYRSDTSRRPVASPCCNDRNEEGWQPWTGCRQGVRETNSPVSLPPRLLASNQPGACHATRGRYFPGLPAVPVPLPGMWPGFPRTTTAVRKESVGGPTTSAGSWSPSVKTQWFPPLTVTRSISHKLVHAHVRRVERDVQHCSAVLIAPSLHGLVRSPSRMRRMTPCAARG